MKRGLLFFLTIAAVVFCLGWETGTAQRKKYRNFTISTGPDDTITDCGQVSMRVDDLEIARSDQERTLSKSEVSSLRVRTAEHGGIHVQGWARDHYSIRACLAAAGDGMDEAQKLLSQVSLSVQNGQVSVEGPGGEPWMGYLIILAPSGAVMDLESRNSPIGLHKVTGVIDVRNVNGPVSLKDVGGQVRADVQNGPIDVSGSGGDLRLNVRNGPIDVKLKGTHWENGTLEGHTQNGPLSLKLPADYRSTVRVDASKHSPVECYAVQCKGAARTWDNPNRIEFGGGPAAVQLSTVNGPVTIRSSGQKQ
jgi:hypothetical protein